MTVRAVLDAVGLVAADFEQTLAFFRDELGLDIRVPGAPGGGTSTAAALELLRQDGDSGGPYLAVRVDDLAAAVDRLRARGVRLLDDAPRPGPSGRMVVRIHPSAAGGTLVELRQAVEHEPVLTVRSVPWGDLKLTFLHDGPFRLDGGAMFGIVPRVLWEKRAVPDDRHRIRLSMRPLLVEGPWGRLLIDCGAGDKMDAKARDIYGLDRRRALDAALAEAGLEAADIDVVLATHLHFDHFGGATARRDGRLVPRFPRARYVIRRAEWEDATHPHERNRASYLQEDFVPLADAGVIEYHEGDEAIVPGVRVVRTGGHTRQHQIVFIESGGRTAVFTADLIPTTAHLPDAWVMGYDLFPVETLMFKKRFIREAIEREYLIVFEHDPAVAAGYIREQGKTRMVEPVV